MKRIVFVAIATGLLAAACGDSTPQGGGSAELKDSDIAVPADFEEEAEKDITPATYKGELDNLEKEVESDK